MVLIPGGRGGQGYHVIFLVEVVWKLVIVIINIHLTTSISFHNGFHGLWGVDGTGNVSLKAKMLQQLTAMSWEVMYAIFMDLQKAYDSLDRYRCIEILDGYEVGPREFHILCN